MEYKKRSEKHQEREIALACGRTAKEREDWQRENAPFET
jgi:hypothetical protein